MGYAGGWKRKDAGRQMEGGRSQDSQGGMQMATLKCGEGQALIRRKGSRVLSEELENCMGLGSPLGAPNIGLGGTFWVVDRLVDRLPRNPPQSSVWSQVSRYSPTCQMESCQLGRAILPNLLGVNFTGGW